MKISSRGIQISSTNNGFTNKAIKKDNFTQIFLSKMGSFAKNTLDILSLLLFLINENVAVFAESSENLLTLTPATPSITHFVNESFIIFCKTTHPDIITKWKDPTRTIRDNSKGRIHIEKKTGLLALVFKHIALEDKGNWSCEGTVNGQTDIRKSFELLVNQKISFGNTELVQSAREARDATVYCLVKGDPTPDVSWLFNGEYLNTANSTKYKRLSDGLFIKNVSQSDAGEYTCRAMRITPTFSDQDQITILLRIQHKPHWFENDTTQSKQFAFIGGTINITCAAMGEPPPSFTWIHDNKAITGRNYRLFLSGYASTLQIHVKNESNFGDYKCKVANSLGTLERTIKLTPGQKPITPTRFQLKRLLTDGFELDIRTARTANLDENMQIFGYRVEYMSENDFKYIAGNWSYAKRIEFSFHRGHRFIIKGLERNTTYLMRAASVNVAGHSDWSLVKKFTTLSNLARRTTTEISESFLFLLITAVYLISTRYTCHL